jgi:hypothetical protein
MMGGEERRGTARDPERLTENQRKKRRSGEEEDRESRGGMIRYEQFLIN